MSAVRDYPLGERSIEVLSRSAGAGQGQAVVLFLHRLSPQVQACKRLVRDGLMARVHFGTAAGFVITDAGRTALARGKAAKRVS